MDILRPLCQAKTVELTNNEVVLETRQKLMKLLQEAKTYQEPTLLSHIVTLPLYEEQIVLYSRVMQTDSKAMFCIL